MSEHENKLNEYEKMKKALFGDSYCSQQTYIIEAFFANPHKYPDSDREPLREHMRTCDACYDFYVQEQSRQL